MVTRGSIRLEPGHRRRLADTVSVGTAIAAVLAGLALNVGWPGGVAAAILIVARWRRGRVEPAPGEEMTSDEPAAPARPFVHSVSGLQTREPLLAEMARRGRGALAIIAFNDYDRLCAFDPGAADRFLRVLTDRMRGMLPASRMIAHVDRGHLAVWAAGAGDEAAAQAEFKALVYALGAPVADEAGEILPEVGLRHLSFDGANESPEMAVARTIASFAVTEGGGVGQPDQVMIARDRFLLEQDLRQAIARGELQLAYQPLVDAREGRVCGAEALLRWHRDSGPISPSRFVPIMEAAGLSREIGLWALNAALREAAGWSRAGLGSLRVAVNVSAQQMTDDDLSVVVQRTLARHGLPAAALEVELTESVALNDAGQAARVVQALRAQGVAVAIDDFGTGYSSLSAMRRLAFDKIKIDREFVTDVHRRPASQAICQSVIALGRGLGLRVLAEGVEQRAEVDWLRRHSCRHFQGFYFAPPLTSHEFVRFAGDRERVASLLATDAGSTHRQIIRKLSS